jgi:hypothetical protein
MGEGRQAPTTIITLPLLIILPRKQLHDPLRGMSVPQFRAAGGDGAGQGAVEFGADALHVVADEDRGAAMLAQGDRPFGLPAQGEAGRAQDAAFFLQTTAVG